MPNYEYKCTQDGSRFELWQEVGAEAPACPTCGAPSKKVFSPPRVIFKGSGFYLTDLRAEQSAGKGESSKSEGGESSSSETKTESKTESSAAAAPAASTAATPSPSAPSAKTD